MLRKDQSLPLAVSHLLAAAAISAVLAAGGTAQAAEKDKTYDRIVVFGDSISDSGNYADKAPAGAGKFTTNPDDVWVEVIAKDLQLELTPHAEGGSNYAEGGARVALQRPDAPGNLTRRPVTEQVADFMANDGRLTSDSLVIIQGGGNDVFATKSNGPSDTPADLEVLRVAAEGLADQVSLLIDAGAGTVVTTSVPKFQQYNDRYDAALASRGLNVLYVDMAGLISEIESNPSEFGIVNVTDRACRGFALEAFTCLPEDYVTPDANRTYLYADGVHFTGVVQEIEGDLTLAMLRAPGQFAQLPYMIRSVSRADGELALQQLSHGSLPGVRVVGGLRSSGADLPASAAGGIGEATAVGAQLGLATSLAPGVTAGLYASWSSGEGEFAADSGSFSLENYSLTAFAGYRSGGLTASLVASAGKGDFEDITRRIELGPAVRNEVGQTDGTFESIELRTAYEIIAGDLLIAPFATARYDRIGVDGYTEAGGRSSQVSFADQELETLELGGGIRLTPRTGADRFTPWIEVGYADDVLNDQHTVSVLPSGAPVWFTSDPLGNSGGALSYGIGVNGLIGERAAAGLSLRGREADGGQSDMAVTASLSIGF